MSNDGPILITGATGFVASYVARSLAIEGKEIHLFVRDSSNLWRLEDLKGKFHLHNVDLTNRANVQSEVKSINPERIFHLATYGAYPEQKDPDLMVKTNFIGTMNLVDACKENGFKSFINVSSSSEYGIKDKPIFESDVLEPNSLYGITKAAATHYCRNLALSSVLPITTFRIFSAYGYFEEPKRLFPSVILSYLNGKPPKLASASSVRDFIFLEDIYSAFIKASEKSLCAQVLNLATGKQHTVEEVAKIVSEITGVSKEPQWGATDQKRPEPKSWVANMQKTEHLLDWKPKYSLRKGLEKDIEWFKENKDKYSDKYSLD